MPTTDGKRTFDEDNQCIDIKIFSPRVQEYIEYEGAIATFNIEDKCWKSYEEMEAYNAQGSIYVARQEILKLQAKIKKWEEMIVTSNRKIQKYKRQQKSESSGKPGKPVRSEHREEVVKKFTMKWVASLIDALDAKGCGPKRGLEMLIPSTLERTWRRWLNGDSIPPYLTFENLLGTRIAHGKYAGKAILDVPVTPSHDQILTLLRFI